MNSSVSLGLGVFLVLLSGPPVTAKERFSCGDDRTRGWNFYCESDHTVEEQEPEEVPQTPVSPPAPPTFTEQVESYRAHVDELKNRAILQPTSENLVAYMEAQQDLVRKATVFTEQWQRQVFANPKLDANVKRPISSVGINLYQDQLDVERDIAVRDATVKHALMFVYSNTKDCYVCSTQADVLVAMSQTFEFPVLAVSKDGFILDQFPKSVVDTGQLRNLELTEVPTPFVALVEPKSGEVDLIGAGLMTQDILVDRIRVVHAIPEGELYE